jgi:hypothetical protein
VALELVAELRVVAHQAHLLRRAPDEDAKLRGRERLGDVVVRARPDRLHAGVDRREAGDHHHERLRGELLDLLEERKPVHVREHEVRQHHVRVVAPNDLQRVAAAALAVDGVPLAGQDLAAALDQQLLVIDDQHADGKSVVGSVAHRKKRGECVCGAGAKPDNYVCGGSSIRAPRLPGNATAPAATDPVRLSRKRRAVHIINATLRCHHYRGPLHSLRVPAVLPCPAP